MTLDAPRTEGNCEKRHNGDIRRGTDKFSELTRFPATRFGNRAARVAAFDEKWIAPASRMPVLRDDANEPDLAQCRRSRGRRMTCRKR